MSDIMELSPEQMERIQGGTAEEAEAYLNRIFQQYGVSSVDELCQKLSADEISRIRKTMMEWFVHMPGTPEPKG